MPDQPEDDNLMQMEELLHCFATLAELEIQWLELRVACVNRMVDADGSEDPTFQSLKKRATALRHQIIELLETMTVLGEELGR